MFFPLAQRFLCIAVAIPVFALAMGCASPGPPLPPSLYLPSPAKSLQAQRVGDRVVLTWTTPDDTTDHQAVRLPITAAICVEIIAAPRTTAGQPKPTQHQAPCVPVQRQTVAVGETRVTLPLSAALLADPPKLLAYRVELENAKGRSAPAPAPAYAASGVAPPPAGSIHVKPTREGAAIEWTAQASSALMELHRTLLPDPNAPAPAAKPAKDTPFAAKQSPQTETNLRPRPSSDDKDSGGLIDPSAKPPNTYAYVAQRVRIVTLGSHTLELHGEPSPAVVFMDHDIFPPRVPTGLTAIASSGFNGPPSIDLSWEPNVELDLLGYNVYRSDSAGGPFRKLNGAAISGPAYRDLTAEPGHAYAYSVTAVDEHHNESDPGPSIRETIHK